MFSKPRSSLSDSSSSTSPTPRHPISPAAFVNRARSSSSSQRHCLDNPGPSTGTIRPSNKSSADNTPPGACSSTAQVHAPKLQEGHQTLRRTSRNVAAKDIRVAYRGGSVYMDRDWDEISSVDSNRLPQVLRDVDRLPEVLRDFLSPGLYSLSTPSASQPQICSLSDINCPSPSTFIHWCTRKIQKAFSFCTSNTVAAVSPAVIDEQYMHEYLDTHPYYLQNYLVETMSLNTIEKLHSLKIELAIDGASPEQLNYFGGKRCIDKQNYAENFQALFKEDTQKGFVLEYSKIMKDTMKGEAHRTYRVCSGGRQHRVDVLLRKENGQLVHKRIKPETILLKVLKHRSCMTFAKSSEPLKFETPSTDVYKDLNFKIDMTSADLKHSMINHKLFKFHQKRFHYVIFIPILASNGNISHVVEIWRPLYYNLYDVEVAANYMVWGSLAINFGYLMISKTRESNKSHVILQTMRNFLGQMASFDKLIDSMFEMVQNLVEADRVSLFLVDNKKKELLFIAKNLELCGSESGKRKIIRFPITRGIAGHVAQTGSTVNISDADTDFRFNKTVDGATGYRTTNILCMPIKEEERIIGVVQMVNKRGADKFNVKDEESFKAFATYFAVALHHGIRYVNLKEKEQKTKAALEKLSYDNTCRVLKEREDKAYHTV